mgnify:FL=1|jgi:DNA gyrase/topoisomerase IV subunit B
MRTFINVMATIFCFITVVTFLTFMHAAGAFGGETYPILVALSGVGSMGAAFITFIFVSELEPVHVKRRRQVTKRWQQRMKQRRRHLASISSRAARESVRDCYRRMDEYEQRRMMR